MTPDLHPPKREVFDVPAMTNTDNKGFVRAVDEYRRTDYGLYMARPTPGHPRFDYLESWLLPTLGLRANIFHFVPGHREGQRLYLDVGRFGAEGDPASADRWQAEDWYLDLVDVPGTPLELIDIDELLVAQATGLLGVVEAQQAIGIATATLVGAAEHRHDIQGWLDEQVGDRMTWRDRS